ncbi:hypothetical protein DH2020_042405 [Rehmannia glutinosa]|uniref:WW domain-containing protein n=1 Tax=Rehmannia glutinosa TaxID=99300 RepID=A0ABR0UMG9_REHGL
MGRRKERRFAALSAAGRRVKLDLFAEPSGMLKYNFEFYAFDGGSVVRLSEFRNIACLWFLNLAEFGARDVGGSSAQEEVGGDSDSKSHAKLPSSPSSSGQQPENPLLLLEQYSDDELDEGSSGHNRAVSEDASIDIDEEEKVVAAKKTDDSEINQDKEPMEQLLMDNGSASQDPLQKLEKGSVTESDSDDLLKQTNKMEETTSPATFDEHLVGDVCSCWKMVLHEESNQYYYWNIVTGETSWEVPDILAQANVTTSAEKVVNDTEGKKDAIIGPYESSTPLDMEEGDMTTRKPSVDSKVNCQTSDSADLGTKTDVSNEAIKGESIEDEEGNRDANQSNGTPLPCRHSVESNSGTDLSSKLIKHCESLLDRLNSVKSLNCYQEGQDLKLKCTLEIENRLADIKALASHGSSLLPFWMHSESQIKRLEAAVEGVIQCNNSATLGGFEATLESREGIGDDTEIDASEKKALFTAVESHADYTFRKSNYEANNDGATTTEDVPSLWYSSNYPVIDVGGKSEITRTEKESELAPRPVLHSGEDVDMDVDMEVDDTSSIKSPHGGTSGARYHASTELSNVHNTLGDQVSTAPGEVFGVAPPGEEWIPPPPPDNEPFPPPPPDDEPFPPPPPDEPPETSYPPVSHLGSVQPFPYPEQYTLSYPGSSLEYYGQTNLEVPGTASYTHSDGGQVAVPHLPQYYEAVANLYAVAPVIVNPIEPTTYYGLQNGTLNPVPLISGVPESSGTQSEPDPETLDSGTAGTMDFHPQAGTNLLLETNPNVAKSGDASVKAPTELLLQTSKSQSKVTRSKKRTVAVVSTLRSNKKVSSLVDKWKAAKEELHEEEEEPEDAYEILEKKRQREIEEWRAQQIASGEAKVNANFQPLGGDWRERVKRKRSQRMKESEQSSPDVATEGNQQPDLVELSKGLPSGWQLGSGFEKYVLCISSESNLLWKCPTSETTWTRPTD